MSEPAASHGHPGQPCQVGYVGGEFTTCAQSRLLRGIPALAVDEPLPPEQMPLLDKAVYSVTGRLIGWLGKRAWKRGDEVFFYAMRNALHVGHVEGRLRSKAQSKET